MGSTLTCTYQTHDELCPASTSIGACEVMKCDPDLTTPASGCKVESKAVGDSCSNDRPCHTNGFCIAGDVCDVFYDDSICSTARNSECGVNLCVRDILDTGTDIDSDGCRMVSTFSGSPCLPRDRCIVSTADAPTFCNIDTFMCDGGVQVECADGSTCSQGACILDNCQGDDDDCYRPDDDDADDNGLNNFDDWKAPIIVFSIVIVLGALVSVLIFRSVQKRSASNGAPAAVSGSGRSHSRMREYRL